MAAAPASAGIAASQTEFRKSALKLTQSMKSLSAPREVGHSAARAQHREGFNTLVGQVTLGQVGIILSYDVTRLSRNCSDWYPLLDLCSYKGCLIADVDGLYDPATANGRLLLGVGLHGTEGRGHRKAHHTQPLHSSLLA